MRQHAGGSSVRNSGGSGLGFGGALGERGKHETEMGEREKKGTSEGAGEVVWWWRTGGAAKLR